jgi:hypothetical protein
MWGRRSCLPVPLSTVPPSLESPLRGESIPLGVPLPGPRFRVSAQRARKSLVIYIQTGFLVEARRKANDANHAALCESYAGLQAEKVPQVYYLEGANLLGKTARAPWTDHTLRIWASPGRLPSSSPCCGRC